MLDLIIYCIIAAAITTMLLCIWFQDKLLKVQETKIREFQSTQMEIFNSGVNLGRSNTLTKMESWLRRDFDFIKNTSCDYVVEAMYKVVTSDSPKNVNGEDYKN